MTGGDFLALSFTPILIGALAALACALPGNFLILRRQAMLGDAISHAVLPGIVAGFLLTGSTATLPMLAGAGAAALAAVALIEALRRLGRLDPGSAMGVVFTAMFAAGVLALERSDTSGVHLDVEHALYGSLESLIWIEATGWGSLLDPAALAGLPPELGRVALALALVTGLMWLLRRPLALATFDEELAKVQGWPVAGLGLALAALTALAAVAAFDAVGSILVIAMVVCPPAAARLVTRRLGAQIACSAAFAVAAAVGGFLLAGALPALLGLPGAVSAAGTIATLAGAILALACVLGPARRRLGP
jgi:manganese/zinc/iron transport system permease protein